MNAGVGSRRSGAGLGWIWLLGMTAVALQVLLSSSIWRSDDLHALKIFLDDFFPGEFDVLFCLSACPLANSVDHMFFHQNTNLFGQIGTGRQFRYPLADDLVLSSCRPDLCRRGTGPVNSCCDLQPCGATRPALSRSLLSCVLFELIKGLLRVGTNIA